MHYNLTFSISESLFLMSIRYSFVGLVLALSFYSFEAFSKAQLDKDKYLNEIRKLSVPTLDSLGLEYELIAPDTALVYYETALKKCIAIKDYVAMTNLMNRVGRLYIYYLNDESKALFWLNNAIVIAKKVNNNKALGRAHLLLWIIATHQKVETTSELLDAGLEYALKSNDWELITDAYEIKSNYYRFKNNPLKEEEMSQKAMESAKKFNLDTWFSSGLSYGDILESNGKFKEAQQIYAKLDLIKDKLTQSKGTFVYFNDLCRLQLKLKNYDKAERLIYDLLSSESNKPKPDTFHLFFVYKNLEGLYVLKNDSKKLIEVNEKLTQIKLKLAQKRESKESKIKVLELKSQLDSERKEKTILSLKLKQERQFLILVATVLIILLLFGSIFFIQRSKAKIELQKKELSQLNHTKDKLFAILSHDLRSPVANLENNLMLSKWGALSQLEFTESVHNLGSEVQQVRNMLENLLYWSITQMDGLTVKKKEVELSSIIDEQIELLLLLPNRNEVSFKNQVPHDLKILVDLDHLKIISRNLLQNAFKFSSVNGCITVSYQNENGLQKILFQDDGIGMDVKMLNDLFQTTTAGMKEKATNTNGTGIGLPLVKELVELNGLNISVSSLKGKGTTFSISF